MAVKLRELGTRRFIGDTETMLVHDRWHGNCEDCLMEVLIQNGTARGFSPDSSDQAFQTTARGCFREYYPKSKPEALEPIMNVSVEGPAEFQGEMVGTILQRRGILVGTTEDQEFVRIEAEVPLAEMFGYSTVIRNCTQGRGNFSMEFHSYERVPQNITDDLFKKGA